MLYTYITERSLQDRVQMGIYRPSNTTTPPTDTQPAHLTEFARMLSAGGSDVTPVPEIQRVKFTKNLWNAVLGASAALAHASLRAFFRPPHLEPGREGTAPPPEVPVSPEEDTPSVRATAAISKAAPALGTYTIPFLHDALTEVLDLGKEIGRAHV